MFARDLNSLVIGQAVKLRNEKHTKGNPRWFGPFEVAKILDNNAYIIVDHDGVEYPRPVNGNSLRPVALRSLIVNDMWAAPPAKAQREKRADVRVEKSLLRKAAAVAKTKYSPVHRKTPANNNIVSGTPPKRRLKLRLGPPPAGSGTAPV